MSSVLQCPHCGDDVVARPGQMNILFFSCTNPTCGAITSFRNTETAPQQRVRYAGRARTANSTQGVDHGSQRRQH